MQHATLIMLAALVATNAGCGVVPTQPPVSGPTDSSMPPLKLTQSDFIPALPFQPIDTQDELARNLRNSGFFLKEETSTADDDDDDSPYLKCMFALYDSAKINATGEHLELHISIDGSSCMPLSPDFKSGTYVYRSSMYLSCAGGDFSDLDGRGYGALPDEENIRERCKNAPAILEESYQKNLMSAVIDTVQPDGSVKSYESEISSLEARAAEGMKPCRTVNHGGVWTLESGCRNQRRETFLKMLEDGMPVIPMHKTETLISATADNLGFSPGQSSSLYQAGHFNVKVNDWKGTVKYTDQIQAPEYHMQRGNDIWSGALK